MRIIFLTFCLLTLVVTPATALDDNLAKQVLAEINLARSRPASYANFIREFRKQFRGRLIMQSSSTTRIKTTEGVLAVDEAITYLSRQRPLTQLIWSDGLAKAATELAQEQGESGGTGHIGRQGRGPQERVEQHGKWERTMAENIGYGPQAARDMVMQLIIDDGVSNRGHRKNIFTAEFGTAGVACGPHPRFGNMCVIDFAGGFRE